MTYRETLDYLYSRLPMFHRIGAKAYKADLSNTLAICKLLGHPETTFKSIHVAGTNGKGSTSHMLAAVFQQAGYKTGLYTSPHLTDFRERMLINGQLIPEQKVIAFVEQYRQPLEQIEPSFFEWTVGLAFRHFADEQIDIAIIETGLGGRLDSTNVITPELSLITNIGMDHMQFLGETLKEIAAEKAGIIKPGIPVVISEKQEEVLPVFLEKARSCEAPLYIASDHYTVNVVLRTHDLLHLDVLEDGKLLFNDLSLDLSGNYQQKNLKGVLQAIAVLREKGYVLRDRHIREALSAVKKLTGFKGRWYKLSEHPLIICDTAHNADGIREVTEQLNLLKYRKLHFVFGAVKDKDISAILELLPKTATYYFCSPALPRALEAPELRKEAVSHGLHGLTYESVKDALNNARIAASPDDLILVGGSTFVVAEALETV